jgi:hypothetical protein
MLLLLGVIWLLLRVLAVVTLLIVVLAIAVVALLLVVLVVLVVLALAVVLVVTTVALLTVIAHIVYWLEWYRLVGLISVVVWLRVGYCSDSDTMRWNERSEKVSHRHSISIQLTTLDEGTDWPLNCRPLGRLSGTTYHGRGFSDFWLRIIRVRSLSEMSTSRALGFRCPCKGH